MRAIEDLPAPIVVCLTADHEPWFLDDLIGRCAICGESVRYRPHAPEGASLVCLLCFIVRADPDSVSVAVTSETLEELGPWRDPS
jgi:hypothetical protein